MPNIDSDNDKRIEQLNKIWQDELAFGEIEQCTFEEFMQFIDENDIEIGEAE